LIAQSQDEKYLVSCDDEGTSTVSTLDSALNPTVLLDYASLASTGITRLVFFGSSGKVVVVTTKCMYVWEILPEGEMTLCGETTAITTGSHPRFTSNNRYIYFGENVIDTWNQDEEEVEDEYSTGEQADDLARGLEREHPLYYDRATHGIYSSDFSTPLLVIPQDFKLPGIDSYQSMWASYKRCIALGSDVGKVMIIRWDHEFV
jgi:hypothetical protein